MFKSAYAYKTPNLNNLRRDNLFAQKEITYNLSTVVQLILHIISFL